MTGVKVADLQRTAPEHPDRAARRGCAVCADIEKVRFERGAQTVAPFCSNCGRRVRVIFTEKQGGAT